MGLLLHVYNNTFNIFMFMIYKHKHAIKMESHLPPGWQMFRNPNGQVIYANMVTGQFQDTPPLPPGWQMFRNPNGQIVYTNMTTGQFQDTPPMIALALPPGWTRTTNASGRTVYANQSLGIEQFEFPEEALQAQAPSAPPDSPVAALALPPGWTRTTNASGRIVYANRSLGREQFEFPEVEAQQAQAPSAPPVDPRTEQVKTQYYPHVHPFSRIPPADIIDMLYHPLPPPDLTPDDVDLILNNYVGTAIRDRRTICGDDVDILSCAKKLFTNNASAAQHNYSFKFPIQPASHQCDVPFRWNPANESKKKLDDNPTAFLAGRLFPLNDNTVRWLCSTHTNPIPSMREALESRFVVDFFDTKDPSRKFGQTVIQVATERRKFNSDPQNIENARKAALEEKERIKRQDEQARIRDEQQRILRWQQQQEQAKKDAEKKAEFEDHMRQYRGGLKCRRKQQTKSNASKRKQTKRKQTKRKS